MKMKLCVCVLLIPEATKVINIDIINQWHLTGCGTYLSLTL